MSLLFLLTNLYFFNSWFSVDNTEGVNLMENNIKADRIFLFYFLKVIVGYLNSLSGK